MTETRRIVRTISPVTIQLGSQPSIEVQIYFQVRRGGFDFDKRSHKDPSIRNVYRFMVDAMEYDSESKKLKHIKNVSPIEAEYKMNTFRSIFGESTINDWFDSFPEQIISQIDYTSTNEAGSYFGLKEDDMEIVEIELN
jgi:hypothetical protein